MDGLESEPQQRESTVVRNRCRAWCYTLNNPTSESIELLRSGQLFKDLACRYMVSQVETGEAGTPHVQGYVYFTHRKSFSQVRDLLPSGSHIEAARGSAEQNRVYCTKSQGRLQGPFEFGRIPRQGERTDIKDAMTLVKNGVRRRQIAETYPNTWCRYWKALAQYRLLCSKKRDWKTRVVYVYGPTGTGKSRFAATFKNAYWKPSGTKWFDGYQNEPVVVMDEMNKAWFSFDTFKRLLDRYPMIVEPKLGGMNFDAHTIIITSNVEPKQLYRKLFDYRPNAYLELIRRIDVLIFAQYRGMHTWQFLKDAEQPVEVTNVRLPVVKDVVRPIYGGIVGNECIRESQKKKKRKLPSIVSCAQPKRRKDFPKLTTTESLGSSTDDSTRELCRRFQLEKRRQEDLKDKLDRSKTIDVSEFYDFGDDMSSTNDIEMDV